uniref:cilia- and flagella-associated protein 184-like isoform X2 n=1 Tax=Myxine glutinosa TaxID=7769 RepID=UPI00358EB1ED
MRLQDEHKSLQQQNNKLQLLLAEYFQHIKCESRFSDDCTDEEKERCYHNNLAKLKELPEEAVDQKEHFEEQLKKVQEERQKIEDILETEMETFVVYKREVILRAMKRHGGKCVSLEDLERLQQVEERREKELARVQLENIKLNMRFSKYQEKFKTQCITADGKHLIDYEELEMENHIHNEKIEEQKEALQKLKREISSKTHTLIQMKKNQEFVKAENLVKRCSLMKLEAQVKENKEARKKLKQSRDSKRLDVQCLQRKSGLLSNMDLLRDFEEHSDSIDALKEKLDQLKMRYTQLTQ